MVNDNLNKGLLEKATSYVVGRLERELPSVYVYHSVDHTLLVYKNSQIIGKAIGFSDRELLLVGIAAIFHDLGYIGYYDDHESLSRNFARTFLEQNKLDEESINIILEAIMATKVPQKPQSVISKALCDADLMHLSSDEYFDSVEPMRKEWKLSGRFDYSELEFHKQSVDFFENHKYHTTYGREVLEKLKGDNLKLIKKKISKL